MIKNFHQRRIIAHRIPRCAKFSTPANNALPTLTPEEIAIEEKKIAAHKKFIRHSYIPTELKIISSVAVPNLPENPAELGVLNGMPDKHAKRTVYIAQKAQKSQQSGDKHSHQYTLTWRGAERWRNPLMGWTSVGDPLANVRLSFDTKEEAINFAKRNGWKYETTADNLEDTELFPMGSIKYSHNFLSKRVQAEIADQGLDNKIFDNPAYGSSHFFMPLKYHGDGEVSQHGPKQN